MKSAKKPVSYLIILSIVTSFFILPATPAQAGILSKFLCAIKPLAGVAGKVAGAVIGGGIGAAFCPPLGMIAGAVVGWIAGGIITGTATASLTNLATLGCGVVGAMALGPGAVGMVGGFLLGGFLGRMAMKLLTKADGTMTGGLIFKKASNAVSNALGINQAGSTSSAFTSSTSSPSVAPVSTSVNIPVSSNQTTNVTVSSDRSSQIQAAEAAYKTAYDTYIDATNKGNTAEAANAHKVYLNAYQEYQTLSSK